MAGWMMRCARRHERHVIAADPAAVRDLLIRLEQGVALAGLTPDERDCTLLVLGEVLNNVVEHGYAGAPGWIGLMPGPRRDGRDWRIVDHAERQVPEGCFRAEMPEEAAEGGFGWPLIMALTEAVATRRRAGFNVMTLQMRADTAGQDAPPRQAGAEGDLQAEACGG